MSVVVKQNFFTKRPNIVPKDWVRQKDASGDDEWAAPATSPLAGWVTDNNDTEIWFENNITKEKVWDLPTANPSPIKKLKNLKKQVKSSVTNSTLKVPNPTPTPAAATTPATATTTAAAPAAATTPAPSAKPSAINQLKKIKNATPKPPPKGVPADWYYKSFSNTISGKRKNEWIAPEGSFKGWSALLDEDGTAYFADPSQKTHWNLPSPINTSISKIQKNLITAKQTLNKLNSTLKSAKGGARKRSTKRSSRRHHRK